MIIYSFMTSESVGSPASVSPTW